MNVSIQPRAARNRFDGVARIARYNWPQYMGGFVTILIGVIWLRINPSVNSQLKFAGWTGIFFVGWWCIASLVASHWIYDRSELYRWTWIPAFLPTRPVHWLNLHAGLDESSDTLRELFPTSSGRVGDFYDPKEMSEPSIRRAREEQGQSPAERIDFRRLPFVDGTFDTVFLLFAAHEIRVVESREGFFQELNRVLTRSGKLLLVEHARDAANFAAFGPGFFHFMSANEWHRLANLTNFRITKEQRMTPFVKVLLMEKRI
jgi:SAM-dependent methyltransferase